MTKKERLSTLKTRLKSDTQAAVRAMLVIYERQTEDEKRAEVTAHENGVGFGGADAEILTSFTKQYLRKGSLSEKQTALVMKKMHRYAGQIIRLGEEAKLDAEPVIERTEGETQNCRKCGGTGRFLSYAGKDVGPCFSCNGSGTKAFTQAVLAGWSQDDPEADLTPEEEDPSPVGRLGFYGSDEVPAGHPDEGPMDLETFLATYGSAEVGS